MFKQEFNTYDAHQDSEQSSIILKSHSQLEVNSPIIVKEATVFGKTEKKKGIMKRAPNKRSHSGVPENAVIPYNQSRFRSQIDQFNQIQDSEHSSISIIQPSVFYNGQYIQQEVKYKVSVFNYQNKNNQTKVKKHFSQPKMANMVSLSHKSHHNTLNSYKHNASKSSMKKRSSLSLKEYQNPLGKNFYLQSFDEATKQKLLIVKLHQMGFQEESVERAIYYGGARSLEECIPYLVLNENRAMEHQFMTSRSLNTYHDIKNNQSKNQFCLLCLKNRKKQTQKTLKQLNESVFSRANSKKSLFKKEMSQNEALQSENDVEHYIHVLPNRVILNNKKLINLYEQSGLVVKKTMENEFMFTQQDKFKSALSIKSNPHHQKTETFFDQRRLIGIEHDNEDMEEEEESKGELLVHETTKRNLLEQTQQNEYSPFDGKRNLSPLQNSYKFGQTFKSKHQNFGDFNGISSIKVNDKPLHTDINSKKKIVFIQSDNNYLLPNDDENLNEHLVTQNEYLKEIEKTKQMTYKKQIDKIRKRMTVVSFNPSIQHSNSYNQIITSSKKDSSKEFEDITMRSQTNANLSENEEKCLICMLPQDMHSPDYNMELLQIQLRFNEQTIFKETENHRFSQYSLMSSKLRLENTIENNREQSVNESRYEQAQLLHPSPSIIQSKNYLAPNFETKEIMDPSNNFIEERYRIIALNFRNELAQRQQNAHIIKLEVKEPITLTAKSQCIICYAKFTREINFKRELSTEQIYEKQHQLLNDVDQQMIRLEKCKHIYCKECLHDYIEFKIMNGQVNLIDCPVCRSELPHPTVRSFLKSHGYLETLEIYKKFKKNYQLNQQSGICFCPNAKCSQALQFNGQEFQLQCSSCYYEFCQLTGDQWHKGKSCKQHLDELYNQAAKGKEIQMCPYCNRMIEKAQQCNHQTCTFCMKSFCILCRNEFQNNHMTPFHAFVCTALNNEKENKHSGEDTSVAHYKKSHIILAVIAFVLLSPFISVLVLPYIAFRNVHGNKPFQIKFTVEKQTRKRQRNTTLRERIAQRKSMKFSILSGFAFVGTLIISPITYLILQGILVYTLITLKKKKRVVIK